VSNTFKEALLDRNTFCVTWELIPGRGAREKTQEAVLSRAAQAAAGGKIHALTLTDMPGGNPALAAEYLGMEIRKLGVEPLIHFTCKDRNRNQIESQLYAMERSEIRNLLVMSGDYPGSGYQGRPKPVFDLDPIQVLELTAALNQGLPVVSRQGPASLQPSSFFTGCVVSPFKATEAELMLQYYKLKKKIAAGAQFVVTQLGYDIRKFQEALQVIRRFYPQIPVLGNIYLLPYGAGKMMQQNQLPGCVVTAKLLAELDQERNAADKGLGARLLRAAKLYALLKGLGFDGVHIGGHQLAYAQIEEILQRGEELSPHWQDWVSDFDDPQSNGFYFFTRDSLTGLNTDLPTERERLPLDAPVGISYRGMRFLHYLLFTPGKRLFPFMRKLYSRRKNPRRHFFEHIIKVVTSDCRDCGDCALLDTAYLCPMSQCPKNQRNGPCGGSYRGWCEVYPQEKPCVWVRAYARLKSHHQESQLDGHALPPANWELYQTSAWYNFYTGRDHSAAILGIEPLAAAPAPTAEKEAPKS
jgi:methylenetetrahydrofolate reductase (NADPH)